jgi:2-polyprenyl-6-methoxyphenol hydroxylase-like FAD-dependent oxidoreductase
VSRVDVAIVGGGIGGSSLAGFLARTGRTVLVLERERTFADRVRGEWIAPWGVTELRTLGLYDRFLAAGAHHLSRHIGYDELLAPEQAETRSLPLPLLTPGIPGPLCLEHVVMQNESLAAAVEAGADVRRGVNGVEVRAGAHPEVTFTHEGSVETVAVGCLVGADGRTSTVRRQLGLVLEEGPLDHLIAGLLIEGAEGWPEDLQAGGQAGDICYLIFPQGAGQIRLYADFAADQRGRFSGKDGAQRLLAAFAMPCVPRSDAIAGARPIGPCRAYPSQDAWLDAPVVDGAVLIGDAAGYNDPIIGQGLSITLRDARMVGEILAAGGPPHVAAFAPYAEERRERMRRLRAAALFMTDLNARFGPEAHARRARALERIAADPTIMAPLIAVYVGPDALEPAFFEDAHRERVFT